jgi:hypothetical protein
MITKGFIIAKDFRTAGRGQHGCAETAAARSPGSAGVFFGLEGAKATAVVVGESIRVVR